MKLWTGGEGGIMKVEIRTLVQVNASVNLYYKIKPIKVFRWRLIHSF